MSTYTPLFKCIADVRPSPRSGFVQFCGHPKEVHRHGECKKCKEYEYADFAHAFIGIDEP